MEASLEAYLNTFAPTFQTLHTNVMPPVSARVSNIDSSVTKEILFEFFNAKGLLLADGQYIALVSTATGNGNSTVLSFLNEAAYKKALALPRADLILEGKVIQIDDNFEGLTSLSEGNQIECVLHLFFKDNLLFTIHK